MAPQQEVTFAPDQLTPVRPGGAEVTFAPDQLTPVSSHAPQALQPPPFNQTLTNTNRPAKLIGPPSFGETIRQSIPSMFAAGTSAAALAMGQPELTVPAASLGGWAGKGVQQAIRAAGWGPPPSADPATLQSERLQSGALHGAAELAGPLVMWPVQKLGGKFLAEGVAKNASASLERTRTAREADVQSALDAGQQLLTRSRTARAETLQTVREAGTADLHTTGRANAENTLTARQGAAQNLRAARTTARAGRAAAKGELPMAVSHAQDQVAAIPPPAISRHQAGRQVAAVVEGPAKASLDTLGQAVEEAAATGGMVKTQPTKDKIYQMLDQFTPSTRGGVSGDAKAVAATYADAFGGGRHLTTEEMTSTLKRAGVALEPEHPLPGLLGEIASLPEEISLRDAHIFKRKLDMATNWGASAKGETAQMTKGTRIALRRSMEGHAPYDEANAAYERTIPLFQKGTAGQVRSMAVANPGGLIKGLKPDQGQKLQMLREVLVEHGGPEGATAWNHVRSRVVSDHLIKGDVTKLSERLGALDPEFVAAIGHDVDGQTVLQNLRTIATTVDDALAQGKQRVVAATEQGRAGIEGAQVANEAQLAATQRGNTAATAAVQDRNAARYSEAQTGSRRAVSQRVEEVRGLQRTKAEVAQSTPEEEALAGSTLAAARPPMDTAREVVHAMLTHNYWRASAIQRLLKGPDAAELVHWASYSPARTQMWVKAVTSDAPAALLANLARVAGINFVQGREKTPQMAVSHTKAASPPPK